MTHYVVYLCKNKQIPRYLRLWNWILIMNLPFSCEFVSLSPLFIKKTFINCNVTLTTTTTEKRESVEQHVDEFMIFTKFTLRKSYSLIKNSSLCRELSWVKRKKNFVFRLVTDAGDIILQWEIWDASRWRMRKKLSKEFERIQIVHFRHFERREGVGVL